MTYQPGDCLTLRTPIGKYIAVFIAGGDEQSFHLAFMDYREDEPPEPDYLQHCAFHVVQFGTEDQPFAAFEAVSIDKNTLEVSADVIRAGHIDIPGMTGLSGMTSMAEVSDITSYFDQHLANPEAQEEENEFLPFQRATMNLTEIAMRATPVNPFPTAKLYKPVGGVLQFWSIYGQPEPPGLVYTWGRLGVVGQYRSIDDKDLEKLKKKYRQLVEEKRRDGYVEWLEPAHMILQFSNANGWGNGDDLGFRNAVWDLVNRYLFWTGNGSVDGGDIGSGTVNLFFHAISASMAVDTIRTALAEEHIRRPFLIAVGGGAAEERGRLTVERDESVEVIYPEDHPVKFTY